MEKNPVCRIFWFEGGPANLENLPWADFPPERFDLKIEPFSNRKDSINKIYDASKNDTILLIIYDLEKEEEIEIIHSFPERTMVFIVVSGSLMNTVKKRIHQPTRYILQRPIRDNEFFLVIEKSIVAEYLKFKNNQLSNEEGHWLSKIEKVFEMARQELLEKDKTSSAYENLIQYDERLLEEQHSINEALVSLQEFRDSEKKEWEQERQARQAIEDLQVEELKAKDLTLKAQENLLEFNRTQKMAYFKLLEEFQTKGTLTKKQIADLLEEHKTLISKVEGISK